MEISPKRILFVSTRFHPDLGGIESSIYNLATGIAALGYTVTVLCTGKKDELVELCGVKVVRRKAWFSFSSNDINPMLLLDLIALVRSNVLVFTNEPNPFTNSLLSFVMLLFRKPLVVYYHSDIIRTGAFSFLKLIYQNLFQRMLFMEASLIISTTKRYQEISDILPRHKSKLGVLPNSIDLGSFTRPSPQQLAEFRKSKGLAGKKVILFVGRLIYYKGLDYLIRAYSEVVKSEKNSVLVIVGTGELEQSLKSLVKSLSLEDRVRFMGKAELSELKLYYSSSDFLVLPSIYKSEAFGIVLLEAMAYGLPVLTTSISGTKEVAEGAGLVVQPKDEKALASSMLRLLGDTELAHDLGIAAMNKVRRYSAEQVVKELDLKIKALLGN